MELWASGFNAWGQLNFDDEQSELPQVDCQSFTCILKDDQIKFLRTNLSATLVRTSKGIRISGCPDPLIELEATQPEHSSNLAIAGNDRVVELGKSIVEYANFTKYIEHTGNTHDELGDCIQIVAGQTNFTALGVSGEVWSWGDVRYEATLGREVSIEHPASIPCQIVDLSGLPTGPVRKISAGGYVTAALTAGNDLYLWGGRVGQPKILDGMTGEPTPFDLDGEDVMDIAVGNDHILALSVDYRLFVVGSGRNGQLGIEGGLQLDEWMEIVLPLKHGYRPVSVYAGYKTSFVLVEAFE